MKKFFHLSLPILACGLLTTGCFDRGSDDSELLQSDDSKKSTESKPAATEKPKAQPAVASTPKPAAKKPEPATPKPVAKKEETKKPPTVDDIVEKKYPMPAFMSLAELTKNWTQIPGKAVPAQIAAKIPVPVDLVDNGKVIGSTKIQPGTPLKPLDLKGNVLTVASLANPTMRAEIPVDQTNFKMLIEQRYNKGVEYYKNQIKAKREKAKAALLAQPDRLASLTGDTGKSDPLDDPRFGPVKASIQRGEAHPASIDEVVSMRWNGSERVSGEISGSYDTVDVHFEVKTIFGKFPTDYKCLLQGGKVVGWIDPITQEKITKD